MKNEKLLTIGIPTYNGSKFIGDSIESILMQVNNNFDEIEILISDNASNDSTRNIVDVYKNKYPNIISYYLNNSNIGYDRNVDMLFKKAKGKYVEILGDDDFYNSQYNLEKIMKIIKENKNIAVILLSIDFLNIKTNIKSISNILNSDFFCKNGDDFFSVTKWSSAAVSSLIIKKELWNEVNLERYYGTQWIHIGALVNILAKNVESYIISEPMITVRTANSRCEDNFGNQLESGFMHLSIIMEMKELAYKSNTYNFFIKNRLDNNLKDIMMIAPEKYRNRLKLVKIMINIFKYYPIFWLIHLPAILIPSKVYKLLFLGYSKIRSWYK